MSLYRSCRLILLIGFLVSSISAAHASLRLEQVLRAYPEVGQFRPSKEDSFHLGEKPRHIKIGKHSYRVRFFMFQAPKALVAMQKVPFGQWIQAQGLLTTKSQETTRGGISLIYFKSSEELESKGIFYLLSLGPVGDALLEISLDDVLQAAPQIAEFTASNYVFGSGENLVRKIAGRDYELRYFVYWVDPANPLSASLQKAPFEEICKNCNVTKIEARDVNRGYGPLRVFLQTEDMKKRGIHFTLSLRSIE